MGNPTPVYVALTRGIPVPVDDPDCVVVIDVLRSGTSAATALFNGAKAVRFFESVAETTRAASRMAKDSYVLGGERNLVRIEGFHCGNSPADYSSEKVSGKTVLMTTTNGSAAVASYSSANYLFYAAWCTLSATARRIRELSPASIALVCSGTRGYVSLDDIVCAGGILCKLPDAIPADDGAHVARKMFGEYGEPKVFQANAVWFEGGRRLVPAGFGCDIENCCALDRFDFSLQFDRQRGEFVAVQ